MANSAFIQQFVLPLTIITANTSGSVNNAYDTNSAGTVELMLPASAAVGDIIRVGTIQGNFKVTMDVGQSVLLAGGISTASDGTGTITSSAVGDYIEMECVVTNATWKEISSGGILTIV